MFEIKKKKAPFFHLVAAILSLVIVSLTSDLYLWKELASKIFIDQIVVLLVIGGLMFTLHLCVMPFFNEEYGKKGFIMVLVQGILVYMVMGIILIIDALKNQQETVEGGEIGSKTVYFNGYKQILSAGAVGLGASVVFLIEIIIYFVKPQLLE